MNKFLISTSLLVSFFILSSCANSAHSVSPVVEFDGQGVGELSQEQLHAMGIEISWSDNDEAEIISLFIDSKTFVKCSATNSINYVIWANNGDMVYREKIKVDKDITKTFFMDIGALKKYQYFLYIDGARVENLTEDDDVCSSLRKTTSSIRIKR